MEQKLNRIDYLQTGLTSKNSLKVFKSSLIDDRTITAVIGDHSGSIHCFSIKTDSNNVNTIFKTLPGLRQIVNQLLIVNFS